MDEAKNLIEDKKLDTETDLKNLQIVLTSQRQFTVKIVEVINKAIKDANETESVDERIGFLVKGLSDINLQLNNNLKTVQEQIYRLDTELQLLDKLIQDFEAVANEGDKKKELTEEEGEKD